MGMHIVGTDEITVDAGQTVPAGHRHAIDVNGKVLCRNTRARFVWPALTWTPADAAADACPLCVQVHRSQQMFAPVAANDAYPLPPTVAAPPMLPMLPMLPSYDEPSPSLPATDSVA